MQLYPERWMTDLMRMVPTSGWPRDPNTRRRVYGRTRLALRHAEGFYIGRTSAPYSRERTHERMWGARVLVPVYWTKSIRHAREVEEDLLLRFYDEDRCLNRTFSSGGGVAGGEQWVYVAVRA